MLSNVPDSQTLLRLAAGKSFSLSLHFKDSRGVNLPLEDTQASLVIARNLRTGGEVVVTKRPTVLNESQGIVRFDLQAKDLDLTPGEYVYEVTVESLGYSSMVVRGSIELEPSFDRTFTSRSYDDPGATGNIAVVVSSNRITIHSTSLAVRGAPGLPGAQGPPGDPFADMEIIYDPSGRIVEIQQIDGTTFYTYNPDGTIDTDSRNGVTRKYNYSSGRLTSVKIDEGA